MLESLNRILVVFFTASLISLCAIGCGEGDGIISAKPKMLLNGRVFFTENVSDQRDLLRMYNEIMTIGVDWTELDSARLIDSLPEHLYYRGFSYVGKDWFVNWHMELEAGALNRGDSVNVEFWAEEQVSSGYVTLISNISDSCLFSDMIGDSVALNLRTTITWENGIYADWYDISVTYVYDSAGSWLVRVLDSSVVKAELTLPSKFGHYPGEFRIKLAQATGTDPTKAVSNIRGGLIEGTIYCNGKSVERTIIVGGGLPAR